MTYLGRMIWPVDLAVFYPHPGVWPLWQVISSAFVLVAITVAVIVWMRRYPYLIVGWFWYAGTLVPVSGLIQVGEQSMADRYTYVPLVGAFIMVSWGMYDLFRRWRNGALVLPVLAVACLSLLLAVSTKQVRYWENGELLFRHALQVTGRNYLAENNLGLALLDANRPHEAEAHFRNVLRMKPRYTEGYSNLGIALARQGKESEAVECYVAGIRLNGKVAGIRQNLGDIYFRTGRIDEAIAQYGLAFSLKPQDPGVHNSLGLALMRKGRLEDAAAEFRKTLRIQPLDAEANNNLAMVLTSRGSFHEALVYYARAIGEKKDFPEAHNNMGVALASGPGRRSHITFSGSLAAETGLCGGAQEPAPRAAAARTLRN